MRKRILIADDDIVFQKLLAFEFERRNHDNVELLIAEDGQDAMQIIDREQPHIMVLDLRMPKEDGFGVLEHLRVQKYEFPVLVLTHYQNDEFRARCMEAGVKEYLIKNLMGIEEVADKVMEYL